MIFYCSIQISGYMYDHIIVYNSYQIFYQTLDCSILLCCSAKNLIQNQKVEYLIKYHK